MFRPRSRSPALRLIAALLALLTAVQDAAAHVRLESATPAAGAALTAPPPLLRLRFSGHIEQQYTAVALVAPDGRPVPAGAVEFVAGSDREFTVALPPLAVSGDYTVRWRTAGADGHVLEGSYTFTLALPDTAPDTALPRPDTAHAHPPATEHEHGGHVHTDSGAGDAAAVLGRALHFVALLGLIGALAFRTLLLPRTTLAAVEADALRRRAWRTAAGSALLLVAAALLRLWVQSRALHGADRAWSGPLLSLLLTGTTWGRAWVVQAVLLGFFAAALAAAARRSGERFALGIAIPAAVGLAAIPGLSGHAAAAEGLATLAVANDALHVLAAGAWIGTLGLLALSARSLGPSLPHVLRRFSPLALGAAAVLAASGALNALMHLSAPAQLAGTEYGRTLLLKLALFLGVLAVGAWNWRRGVPAAATGATMPLRRSMAFELAFAVAVLAVTAWLTGLPRPS